MRTLRDLFSSPRKGIIVVLLAVFALSGAPLAMPALLVILGSVLSDSLKAQSAGGPVQVIIEGTLDGQPMTVSQTIRCVGQSRGFDAGGGVRLVEEPEVLMHVTDSGERIVFVLDGFCGNFLTWRFATKAFEPSRFEKPFRPAVFFLGPETPPETVVAYVDPVAFDSPLARITIDDVRVGMPTGKVPVWPGGRKDIFERNYEFISVMEVPEYMWGVVGISELRKATGDYDVVDVKEGYFDENRNKIYPKSYNMFYINGVIYDKANKSNTFKIGASNTWSLSCDGRVFSVGVVVLHRSGVVGCNFVFGGTLWQPKNAFSNVVVFVGDRAWMAFSRTVNIGG